MENKKNLTLGILITTTNKNIERVKKELLPQLKNVDEVIISHQVFDGETEPERNLNKKNVKYFYMYDKGLSKNRNNALKYSKADICHICDDDLFYLKDFDKIIKEEYERDEGLDVITFQAVNEKNEEHFKVKEGKHSNISILRICSWGITFRRKSVLEKEIKFDESFGLGTKYCVGEENIFLKDCLDKELNVKHCRRAVVSHKNESSGIDYRDELVFSRVAAFKRMFGFFGGVFAVFYFTIFHHKFYRKKYSVFGFFLKSLRRFEQKNKNVYINEKAFDKNIEKYDKDHLKIFGGMEEERLFCDLKKATDMLKEKKSACDFGCGNGNLIKHLLKLNFDKIHCYDISQNCLDYIRNKYMRQEEKLDFFKINGENLREIKSNTFDFISCYSVLHHIPDYLKGVEEMIRVTKKNGIIFIDHEHNEFYWNNREKLKEFTFLNETKKEKIVKYINPKNYINFFINRTILIFNPRYQKMGDIHVFPDDHIEFDKIKEVFKKNNVEIVEERDYLAYNNKYKKPIYDKFKNKYSDMKLLVGKKLK